VSERKVHEFKCWPPQFQAILDGVKPFEIRSVGGERPVPEEGDVLLLREWSPATREYTGRTVERVVTYVADAERWRRNGETMFVFGLEDPRIERLTRELDDLRDAYNGAAIRASLSDRIAGDVIRERDEVRAKVARLQAIVGNPDTYEALLHANQQQALELERLRGEVQP